MAASKPKPILFYGVNSEGMGHATRSLPVIQRLNEHFDVHVFCGGRVREFMTRHLPRVHDHFFIPLVYRDNRMVVSESFWNSIKRAPQGIWCGLRLLWRILQQRPVAILTDYEFLSTWTGFLARRKVVCVDNNHLVVYADLGEPRSSSEAEEKRTVVTATRWNVPFADVTLLTCFWRPPLQKRHLDANRVRFAPCAVRDTVLSRRARVSTDGPVLIYQTSSTNHRLPGVLREAVATSSLSFVVYGSGQPEGDEAAGRIRYRSFSEDGFLDDLQAAPFVVMNGGHSTIVEALTLHKPVLAEPVLRQFEQTANVMGLEAMGIGRGVVQLNAADIVAFAADAEPMRERLKSLHVVDTDALVATIHAVVRELTGFDVRAPSTASGRPQEGTG